jgi:hypothetical protein
MNALVGVINVLTYLVCDLFHGLHAARATPVTHDLKQFCSSKLDILPERPIPRIIHQTHATSRQPTDIYIATKVLVKMNPTYSYKFYDNHECQKALETHFGPQSAQVKAYNKLKIGAYKADLFRLCILYAEGGVYMDCKATTLAPLSSIITYADINVVADIRQTRLQTGAFLASSPRNPLIQALMDGAVARILNEEYGNGCLDIAGPEFCGRTIQHVIGMDACEPFIVGTRYIAQGTPMDVVGAVRLTDYTVLDAKQEPIIKVQNLSYFMNWKRLLRRYEIAWAFGKVY